MKLFIVYLVSIIFILPIFGETKLNVKNYGAKGDGLMDDTKAIQSTINAASPLTKTTIYFPAGTYKIGSYTTTRNYLENYCLFLHSNIDIEGEGDQTIIFLSDHIFDKRDTSANAHLFYGYKIQNISFSNLVIDMNGSNNLVPQKIIKNYSAIFTSYGNNYYIHDIAIRNCSGTNMINIMSKGRGLIIENCKFINGGNYVGNPFPNTGQYDYSFIYTEWDSTEVQNNIIEQQNIDIALQNYTGGIELHGSNTSAIANTIKGCWPAIYISSSNNSAMQNVLVQNNDIIDCVTGISFWIVQPMSNIFIYNNQIKLTTTRSSKLKLCAGIYVPNGNVKEYSKKMANAAPINNLEINGNTITANSMQMLSAGMVLHSLRNSLIQNNIITGMNYGGIVLTGSKWGTNSLLISKNIFKDFLPNNDKNAVAGYIVITDTYSKGFNDSPGYKGIVISKNKFLRTKVISVANNGSKGIFLGAFIAVPANWIESIKFKDNTFSDSSEKIRFVKTE